MRNIGWGLLALVVASVMAVDLGACGDKFLVPGRGLRLAPSSADRANAAVLIYAPATSRLADAMSRLKTEAALRRAGYRPVVAAAPAELSQASTRTWDAVLFEPAVAADVAFVATANPTALVAVTDTTARPDLDRLRAQYATVLKSPLRNQDVLDALDARAARGNARNQRVALR